MIKITEKSQDNQVIASQKRDFVQSYLLYLLEYVVKNVVSKLVCGVKLGMRFSFSSSRFCLLKSCSYSYEQFDLK